jgi:endo-1,3(4)-beta-glucanase
MKQTIAAAVAAYVAALCAASSPTAAYNLGGGPYVFKPAPTLTPAQRTYIPPPHIPVPAPTYVPPRIPSPPPVVSPPPRAPIDLRPINRPSAPDAVQLSPPPARACSGASL